MQEATHDSSSARGHTNPKIMETFRVSDPVLEQVFWERMFIWKRQGRLAVLDWGGRQSRNQAMARLLELADDVYALPEFGPLTINTSGHPANVDPECVCLGFCEADGYAEIAIPDFVFDSFPETGVADYAETTWEVADAGAGAPQQPGCGWIDGGTELTLPEQAARWSGLLDLATGGYSARLKILLHSGRPVFIQDRPWHEWYWDQLEPMQNFIPVRRDLSDLLERQQWARTHPEQAAAIGRAGQELALVKLTREAAVLQLARTLERLAGAERPSGYVAADLRVPLEPVLERFGAFA